MNWRVIEWNDTGTGTLQLTVELLDANGDVQTTATVGIFAQATPEDVKTTLAAWAEAEAQKIETVAWLEDIRGETQE